jgi:hypothetical protein
MYWLLLLFRLDEAFRIIALFFPSIVSQWKERQLYGAKIF